MSWPDSGKFLEEVLSYVKFPLDKDNIKSELEGHVEDKISDYISRGNNLEEAERLTINDMGDAREIGMELNRQHNPVLGWLWMTTNAMVVVFTFFILFTLGSEMVDTLFQANPVNHIPKSDIVYKIHIDEKVKLDDVVIHFTNVIYQKNGDMSVSYEYYDTKLWGLGWSDAGIGDISDNLGNIYRSGSGFSHNGIISKSIKTVHNFSSHADTLIISYDNYNRKYKVEIPLKTGESHE